MIVASLALAGLLSAAMVPTSSLFPADSNGAQTSAHATSVASASSSELPQPGRFDPARFDTLTAAALRVVFDDAAAHGLPIGPLVNKANSGVPQHASGARILKTVREYYTAMLDARAALGENANESELDSGAEALRNGIDGKTLVAIRATRPASGSAITALVVLTDLVKRGIPTGKARDGVTALARASKSDDPINGLQSLVARNAERGPGMAQDAMDRYLRINAPSGTKNAPPKPAPRPPSPTDVP